MKKYSAKDVKKTIKLKYNNLLKISDKEFFELKRKLFLNSNVEDGKKETYTLDDIQKMTYAKIMIDIGLMPQKAVERINLKWNNKLELINEMKEITQKEIKHLEDISGMIEGMKVYEELGVQIPIITVEGIGEYFKKLNKKTDEIVEKIISKIDENYDEIYKQFETLIKKATNLKNEGTVFGMIKANSYVMEIEKMLCQICGDDIKKYMLGLNSALRDPEIKQEINNLAKKYDNEEFDYADYIGTLILMKYYKELYEKMYAVISNIIDCDIDIINNENVNEHILRDTKRVKKAKSDINLIISEYFPIYEKDKDIKIIINDVYNTTQTLFYIDMDFTKEEQEMLNEMKIYSKLILIAKILYEE